MHNLKLKSFEKPNQHHQKKKKQKKNPSEVECSQKISVMLGITKEDQICMIGPAEIPHLGLLLLYLVDKHPRFSGLQV